MRIELLYFDGCPNHDVLLPRLRELLEMAGVGAQVDRAGVQERDRPLDARSTRRCLGDAGCLFGHAEDRG